MNKFSKGNTHLLLDAEGPDVAVGDVPGEEAVGVFGGGGRKKREEAEGEAEENAPLSFHLLSAAAKNLNRLTWY